MKKLNLDQWDLNPNRPPDPVQSEIDNDLHANESKVNKPTAKPLNSDPDGYVPGKINQATCIARLREAGLLANTDSAVYERILRVALAIDSQEPITPEVLGNLWLAYMHEDVIADLNVLSTAVVGYANRHHIDLPRPGVGTNGHRVTFQEEMRRRCS